jgi:ADP-ribosylglycohydrolase
MLSAVQADRAAGVLLGAACGDALGVPYEFGSLALPARGEPPRMVGGGLGAYAPGEYSDDTQMAVCIAEVAATGVDLRDAKALDQVAANFVRWRTEDATDLGIQTCSVIDGVQDHSVRGLGAAMRDKATQLHQETGRTAGNGSLMRTGPVALAYLDDADALAEAARAVSDLTHHDPLAGDACVLWCEGIRQAVITGDLHGVRDGLALIPAGRRQQWSAWLDEAEHHPPDHFRNNGFVVAALQAAWSAIVGTPIPLEDPAAGRFACQHFRGALYAAVRAGNDTDTVAAIAGALLGARWGSSAVPLTWQREVHGRPGNRAADLIRLAVLTTQKGRGGNSSWPGSDAMQSPIDQALMTFHPADEGVVLGNLLTDATDSGADAVVSLCRVGRRQFPNVAPHDQVQVWLVDQPGANNNPAFTLDQAARMVQTLRDEGRTVLLHCAAGQSRTPAVAARYTMLKTGLDSTTALAEMRRLLTDHGYHVNGELRRVVEQFA